MMHIDINNIINFFSTYSTEFLFLLSFLLGVLFSYVIFVGKKTKDVSDKKKLESYVKGINYIIEDETDKAIEELTDTAKLDPDLIDIYISIGNLFRKKGEINRALIIHKSLLVRPHLSKEKKLELYINMGIDYRKAGLYDRAKEYFKNALSMNPKNSTARQLLYEVYEDSHDWEDALSWHKRFGKNSDNILAHIYAEIGKERLKENKTDEAKKYFEKSLKVDKKCIDSYLYLGDVYIQHGNIEKAYEYWEKSCKIEPKFANLALNRIEDIEKLKSLSRELLIQFPNDKYILYFCANQMFKIGERQKAISLYGKLIKMGIKPYSVLQKFTDVNKENLPKFIRTFAKDRSKNELKYICTNCGYSSNSIFFRCQKCRSWDKVKVEIV